MVDDYPWKYQVYMDYTLEAMHACGEEKKQRISSNSRRLRDGISGTLTGADWWNLTEEERVPDPSLPGHPIVFASPTFLKLTGYALPEVLGRSVALFQGPLTSRSSLLQIREALVFLNYRKDGSPFWILLCVSLVFNPRSATVVHFLAVQVSLLRHRASSPVRDLSVRERERESKSVECGLEFGLEEGAELAWRKGCEDERRQK
ncbi:hypothetical protein Fmac_004849 [Flemingia macrophylla]|uniref:PAS domain-containing protein n=1 Tax=Flemingia macrophylla TaxID=520843 RepID=A0ABD1N630_9FABA